MRQVAGALALAIRGWCELEERCLREEQLGVSNRTTIGSSRLRRKSVKMRVLMNLGGTAEFFVP